MSQDSEIPPVPPAFYERGRLIGIIALLIGCLYGYFAYDVWKNRDLPIVSGDIVSATNHTRFIVQRVTELVIAITPEGETITVVKPRDTARKLAKTVRFRFGGNRGQRIYFLDHERHPIWVALIFWAIGGFLVIVCQVLLWRARRAKSVAPQLTQEH